MNENGSLDKNDQLQRVAMLYLIDYREPIATLPFISPWEISKAFELRPGIYVRYPGNTEHDVSGDQLISILAAWVAQINPDRSLPLAKAIIKRWGFAQNIHDMYGRTEKKTPDFILFRALPLLWRSNIWVNLSRDVLMGISIFFAFHWSAWALLSWLFISDLPLILMAVTAGLPVWEDDRGFRAREPDDVDDNVIVMTLIACRETLRSPSSIVAPWIYARCRPVNAGCHIHYLKSGGKPVISRNLYGPVFGALNLYHAPPAGNPEIAEAYRTKVNEVFGEKNPSTEF